MNLLQRITYCFVLNVLSVVLFYTNRYLKDTLKLYWLKQLIRHF